MKEFPVTLNAEDVFTLGRAAEKAGFKSLNEFVAYLLLKHVARLSVNHAA